MEPTITYNENPYLTWFRTDCYLYGIQNKDPDKRQLSVLVVSDDGYSFQKTLNYLETVSFTLPGDGVYDITVTALPLDDEEAVEVYEDILVEMCQLQYCFLTLLNQLYCSDCAAGSSLAGVLIGDACKEMCKESGITAGQGGVQADYNTLRLAIVQLNAMLFVFMTHTYDYHLSYTGLEVPPESRAQAQAIIKKLWGQIIAFTEKCGFDCTKGAEGDNKKCEGC